MKRGFSLQQAKYFDEITVSRDATVFFADNRALTTEFEAIIKNMKSLQDKKVLDVGCGSGRHAIRLAKIVQEVVGIDISQKSIDLANSNARKNKLSNFKGVVSDYTNSYRSDYFDYAIMVNAIHHIDHPERILHNIKESLKNNGELIIFEFNPLNPLFVPFLAIHGQIRVHLNLEYLRSNIVSLKNMIRKSGLKIISVERYAFFPTILYNYSVLFEKLNGFLNKIPLINQFCAFHIIRCTIKK